jgi:hypothetical protein
MKRVFLFMLLLGASPVFAQNALEDVLQKAEGLINSGSTKGLVDVVGATAKAVQSEVSAMDSDTKYLLLSQADALKGLVPLALSGKLDLSSFSNIVNKVKIILAANRLKSALKGGKSGLVEQAPKVSKALNLMKNGAEGLDLKSLTKLSNSAIKKADKLDKGGLFKNLRLKATEKKLNKIVDLVGEVI